MSPKITFALITTALLLGISIGIAGEARAGLSGLWPDEQPSLDLTARVPGDLGMNTTNTSASNLVATALATAWSKVLGLSDDGVAQTLLSITGFVTVTDSNLASETRKVRIVAGSDYVEWALWHEGTVTQGTVNPGATTKVDFPHNKPFILQVSRPVGGASKQGALICRENDNALGCISISGGVSAYMCNSSLESLIEIASFGKITDITYGICHATAHHKLRYTSLGPYVEGAIWWQGTYTACDAPAGGSTDCSFPHWYPFFAQISRPVTGQSGWAFCRENDAYINCMQFPGGPRVYLADYTLQFLSNVADFAKVGDRGTPDSGHTSHYYRVTSNRGIVQWATWHNTVYQTGTTNPANVSGQTDASMPHWKLFIISAWRAQQGAYAQALLLCKENDYYLVCYVMNSPPGLSASDTSDAAGPAPLWTYTVPPYSAAVWEVDIDSKNGFPQNGVMCPKIPDAGGSGKSAGAGRFKGYWVKNALAAGAGGTATFATSLSVQGLIDTRTNGIFADMGIYIVVKKTDGTFQDLRWIYYEQANGTASSTGYRAWFGSNEWGGIWYYKTVSMQLPSSGNYDVYFYGDLMTYRGLSDFYAPYEFYMSITITLP